MGKFSVKCSVEPLGGTKLYNMGGTLVTVLVILLGARHIRQRRFQQNRVTTSSVVWGITQLKQ